MAFLEVYRDRGIVKRWRWRRKSANGRIIETAGQGFTRRWSAVRSARAAHPEDGEPRILG